MPHDSKGREIGNGDFVKGKAWAMASAEPLKVLKVVPDAQSCNLQCAAFDPRHGVVTMSANETELLLKADGSEPPPAA
jgi:hypothetical protein